MKKVRRLAVPVVALTVLALLLFSPAAADEASVSFPDPNLESAVRAAIGKASGSINASDVENLLLLEAQLSNITDLTGLEYCTSLRRLELGGNHISDISPLSSLISLTDIYLGGNVISDISSLSGLTNLSSINLGGNLIGDISPLSGLHRLSFVQLPLNEISDISALSGLVNLSDVSLAHNRISDISPLVANSGLGEGDEVNLSFNPLSTASAEEHVPRLEQRGVYVVWGSPPTPTPPRTPTPTPTPFGPQPPSPTAAQTPTAAPTPGPTPTPAPVAGEGGQTNVWLIVGIVLGVVVVGALVYYFVLVQRVARRRAGW